MNELLLLVLMSHVSLLTDCMAAPAVNLYGWLVVQQSRELGDDRKLNIVAQLLTW